MPPRPSGFLAAAALVTEATSFGGVHTSAERRARWGTDDVPDGLLRFSAGLEDTADLVADLRAALDAATIRTSVRIMGRRASYTAGTPCWVDLSTTDLEAARGFYGAVLGWTVRDQPGGMYAFFERDGEVVAGLAGLSPEQAAAGMPPAWSMYVRVDDPDASAARAAELGGTVRSPAFDIPEAGRMAVIADPQGAIFLLWKPAPFEGAPVVNAVGAWAWNDVQTPDPASAAEFYRALFGWEIAEVPESGGVYWSIAHEGRRIAGIMQAPPGVEHPFWATYFGVAAMDDALAQVEASGGRRLAGPMQVPAGRFAAVSDPQGAIFSVIEGGYDD